MRSAPLPVPTHPRGHPKRFISRKHGKHQMQAEEEAQPIPAEPAEPVRTTPAADVRRQPEARKAASEPPAEPEPPKPVEAARETRAPAVPRSAAPPAATPAALPPGTVDPKSVASTVRAHAAEVQACFERALMDGADLHGHLNVSANIDPTGHVISVWPTSSIEGGSRLQTCVLGAFKDWIFAPPSGGVKGRIKYSFSFE
jgi:outer membrane biosynthesis protein TonB